MEQNNILYRMNQQEHACPDLSNGEKGCSLYIKLLAKIIVDNACVIRNTCLAQSYSCKTAIFNLLQPPPPPPPPPLQCWV